MSYVLQSHDTFLDECDVWLLQDLPTNPEELHVQAMVASGDYFETLACTLEQIAAALPPASVGQYQLQHIINTLLYLQRHYEIVKKHQV